MSEELIPPSVHQALQTFAGLQFARTEARESDPVNPVDRKHVDAVLPLVSRQVAAMIELQALTGMRPGEVVQLRPCDIDQSDDIWIFRPASHKNLYRGHNREVPLGPQARAILGPFLYRDPERHCFSPAEAEAERNEKLSGTIGEARKTKVYPSEIKARQQRKEKRATQTRKRPPKDSYEVASYRPQLKLGNLCVRSLKREAKPQSWVMDQLDGKTILEACGGLDVAHSDMSWDQQRSAFSDFASKAKEALPSLQFFCDRDEGSKNGRVTMKLAFLPQPDDVPPRS